MQKKNDRQSAATALREQPGARERIWARIEAELERGAPTTPQDVEGLALEARAHELIFDSKN